MSIFPHFPHYCIFGSGKYNQELNSIFFRFIFLHKLRWKNKIQDGFICSNLDYEIQKHAAWKYEQSLTVF